MSQITFIDLENAFYRLIWELLVRLLKNYNLDWRDRIIIINLYKIQKTEIDIKECKNEAVIRRGLKQECPLSHYLLNLFIEESVTKKKNKTKDIRINGMHIHCIRLADDIVIVGESAGEMENMLETLSEALGKLKLKTNKKKTKRMVVGKKKENVIVE